MTPAPVNCFLASPPARRGCIPTHRPLRPQPRDKRRRRPARRRLAIDGLARVLGQGPRTRVGGDRGARPPLCARARLPPERRRPGPAAGQLTRGRAAGPRHHQPVLQPRAARRPARRPGRRLHGGARRHRQRPPLGGAVLRGAARRPRRRLPALRGQRAGGPRPRRERRAHGGRGARRAVGALRRRGRGHGRLRPPGRAGHIAASATSPPTSTRRPSTCARPRAAVSCPRPASTPMRSRAR